MIVTPGNGALSRWNGCGIFAALVIGLGTKRIQTWSKRRTWRTFKEKKFQKSAVLFPNLPGNRLNPPKGGQCMAKQIDQSSTENSDQLALFPVNPAVTDMAVTAMKMKGGELTMIIAAVTEATSLDQITPEVQAAAHMQQAVRLMNGNVTRLDAMLSDAIGEHAGELNAREADTVIGYARTSRAA